MDSGGEGEGKVSAEGKRLGPATVSFERRVKASMARTPDAEALGLRRLYAIEGLGSTGCALRGTAASALRARRSKGDGRRRRRQDVATSEDGCGAGR
jgi:hypothetical protein